MTVNLSDKAEAISALLVKRKELDKRASSLSALMERTLQEFQEKVRQINGEQTAVLTKMIALDDAIQRILESSNGR